MSTTVHDLPQYFPALAVLGIEESYRHGPDRLGLIGLVRPLPDKISRHGGMAICSPIAPYERIRRLARSMVEDAGGVFVLIHVAKPLAECERRDRKGRYAMARRNELDNFTGITAPYETPHEIVGFLSARGYLEPTSPTQVTR